MPSLMLALALTGSIAPMTPPTTSRESLSISHSPRFPFMDQPVTGVMKLEKPLPFRVCMGYVLLEVGDAIPDRRRKNFPFMRESCRDPQYTTERFEWGVMWDGRYEVYGYSVSGSRKVAPLPIEMVVRP